jgi:hypothetical protein
MSIDEHRIEMDGDYLIIAPNPEGEGSGYVHTISERAWLVDNIANFQINNPKVPAHSITVYELKEVNLKHNTPKVEQE